MATPPSPNDLTRQQLDELDALLQKMLALPLAAGDEPPPAPPRPADPLPGGWRADRLPPPPAPHLDLAAPAPAVYEDEGPPISFDPPPPMVFDLPPEPVAVYQPPPAPRVELPEPPVALTPPPAVAETVVLDAAPPPPAAPGLPVALWPLYLLNAPLEFALGLFGPPGRAMCSAVGKWTLGLAGIGMVAAAGLWVARANGLVRFDLPF